MNQTLEKVQQWHRAKGITTGQGDSKTQILKLLEETGELSAAILREDQNELQDAIGDIIVVLSSIADLNSTSLSKCLDQAWNEIKDRTGKTVDGNFRKDQ